MSKTKTTEFNSEVKPEETKVTEIKISVREFLEKNKQNFYIENLMKKKYALVFNTESKWIETVQELLNKKIK